MVKNILRNIVVANVRLVTTSVTRFGTISPKWDHFNPVFGSLLNCWQKFEATLDIFYLNAVNDQILNLVTLLVPMFAQIGQCVLCIEPLNEYLY